MRKRKAITAILISIIVIAGISSIVLYKLGDRILDEVIDNQITEIERTIEQTPVPNGQQSTTSQEDPSPNPQPQITKDKLEDAKDSVSSTDKMSAAALVLKNLSQSEVNHLTQLAAGGITAEEKAEIKAIVYSKFTQAEIEEIKELYYKYMR